LDLLPEKRLSLYRGIVFYFDPVSTSSTGEGTEKNRFKEIPTPDNINDPHVRANRRVRIVAYW